MKLKLPVMETVTHAGGGNHLSPAEKENPDTQLKTLQLSNLLLMLSFSTRKHASTVSYVNFSDFPEMLVVVGVKKP